MRAVVQRVLSSRVLVDDRIIGEIERGLLVFVGIDVADCSSDADYIAGKLADLRVFDDEGGAKPRKMNRSVKDVAGAVLLVSQLTLQGDCRKGRRPSFDRAAKPDQARDLYEQVAARLRGAGVPVEMGEFQAMMRVELVNDGPVTLLLDSQRML